MRFDLRNLAIAGLGTAVVGLGAAVAVDHTLGAPAAEHQSAALTATSSGSGATPAGPHHSSGRVGGSFGMAGGALKQLGSLVTRDTGLTPQQLFTGIRSGKTLDDLVGAAKAAQLKSDLVAALKTELDQAASKGAISSTDETRLLNDAGDIIDVVMSAHLGSLFPAH